MSLQDKIEEAIEKHCLPCKHHDGTYTIAGITDAAIAILKAVEEALPEEKSVAGEFQLNAVYTPLPRDGDVITSTYINYDERRGWNDCLTEIKSKLK